MDQWISRHLPGATQWLRSCSDVTRWWIVFVIFVPFCVLEAVFGHTEHSSSLIADALHTATDSGSIVVMLIVATVRTHHGRVDIVERWSERIVVWALALCIIPVVWSAVGRFLQPELANGQAVMLIAAFGAVANLVQHWVRDTAPSHHHDHKHHAMMSHIVIDLWMNVLVVVGGLGTMLTQSVWIDPAISLVIIPRIMWELYQLQQKKQCHH